MISGQVRGQDDHSWFIFIHNENDLQKLTLLIRAALRTAPRDEALKISVQQLKDEDHFRQPEPEPDLACISCY